MSYLVDGNNVMGQRVGWHRDKPGAQRALLDELAHFARVRRATVTVVFDGAPLQHFPDGASYRGVRLFYALRGSNADERIKTLVENSRERRTLLIVTSDRALADYVRSCGAQVLRAGEFRQLMEEAARDLANTPDPETADPVNDENLPHWMRYFGVDEEQ
jgi:predicted RNA-binding protein with PIN domain